MTADEIKAAIKALGMSDDELDNFVMSLYEHTPDAVEGMTEQLEKEKYAPEGWNDTLADLHKRYSERGDDFDETAFDDEFSQKVSNAWGSGKEWPSDDTDEDAWDKWAKESGFNDFASDAIDTVYSTADVNGDGDVDVTATDEDGDGEVDTTTVEADTPEEAEKAVEVADDVDTEEESASDNDDSASDTDTDSTGDWGGLITQTLLDHKL